MTLAGSLSPVKEHRRVAPRAASKRVGPRPFLKWAGGKGQLLQQIFGCFPATFRTYYEPFLGGGAVFFGMASRLQPKKGYVLSDVNEELMITYRALRDDLPGVLRRLRRHRVCREYYYALRAQDSTALSPSARAARTIFLNRTCFNGLYRVNQQGHFNVPFGKYHNPTVCDVANLRAVSQALQGVELRVGSVFDIEKQVRRGDLVYFDPPYDPISPTASFTSYTTQGFRREQQEALAALFGRLAARGVHVVLSNSDTPLVRELYGNYTIHNVTARRCISSRARGRGKVAEVLVVAGA